MLKSPYNKPLDSTLLLGCEAMPKTCEFQRQCLCYASSLLISDLGNQSVQKKICQSLVGRTSQMYILARFSCNVSRLVCAWSPRK